jgi:hypothetical protein
MKTYVTALSLILETLSGTGFLDFVPHLYPYVLEERFKAAAVSPLATDAPVIV